MCTGCTRARYFLALAGLEPFPTPTAMQVNRNMEIDIQACTQVHLGMTHAQILQEHHPRTLMKVCLIIHCLFNRVATEGGGGAAIRHGRFQ